MAREAKPASARTARPRRSAAGTTLPSQLEGEGAADVEFSDGYVTIRMYRDILGDCFLLRFPGGDRVVHMLIDCGILQGMPDAKNRAQRIMANIRSLTDTLDILVATHEHVDHLSGFYQAREIFNGITVKDLWLAWTEDPRDEQATRLREGRRKAMALLEKSYSAFVARGFDSDFGVVEKPSIDNVKPKSPLEGLRSVMAFSGVGPYALAASADATTSGILDFLKEKAENVRYLAPGTNILEMAGLPYLKAYVMGPPREDALLRRSNPSKANSEVYELSADISEDEYFLAAADSMSDLPPGADELQKLKLSLPFGFKALMALDSKSETIGAQHDPAARALFDAIYSRPDDEWRKIDIDWLWAAETLALKLDSDTNNTSLALAFEMGDGPKSRVLLFPGDAQVGNWLSWHNYTWESKDKAGEAKQVTATDLLAKTILYKVGHHASHNATLRERGLELMLHEDLVAMIPVQQEFANQTKHWNMPFPSLLERLNQKCVGRVIRADRGKDSLASLAASLGGSTGQLTQQEWGAFLSNMREISDNGGPVALEYRISRG